jgi:nickel superoxide dismutase
MKRTAFYLLSAMAFVLILSANAAAHCEIPCGIYDDEARINELLEHVSTIEKSMNQIMAIDKEKDHNANQIVRWVMNKENHANELQHIVTQYFMTQRIKLDAKNYDKKLGLLHQMLVYAMKSKQTTDLDNTAKLTAAINDFKSLYFAK